MSGLLSCDTQIVKDHERCVGAETPLADRQNGFLNGCIEYIVNLDNPHDALPIMLPSLRLPVPSISKQSPPSRAATALVRLPQRDRATQCKEANAARNP